MRTIKKASIVLIHNHKGIVFPWVTGLATLLLIITFFTIQQYQNHLYINQAYRSYVVRQNLFESAQSQLAKDLPQNPTQEQGTSYDYETPQGSADASCVYSDQTSWECQWNIQDFKGKTKTLKTYYYVNRNEGKN